MLLVAGFGLLANRLAVNKMRRELGADDPEGMLWVEKMSKAEDL